MVLTGCNKFYIAHAAKHSKYGRHEYSGLSSTLMVRLISMRNTIVWIKQEKSRFP